MGSDVDTTTEMSDNDLVDEVEFVTVSLRVNKRVKVPEAGEVPAFLRRQKMYAPSQETVWVLPFDVQNNLRKVVRVAQGSFDAVDVPIAAVLQAVVLSACDRFWLVHNHPGGSASPSPADVDLTEKVMNAANTCGLRMEDHLIIAPPARVFSFREARMIRDADEVVAAAANEIVVNPIPVVEHRTDARS